MSDLNLPLIQTYQPASFAERGVAVPFTTPLLAGARVRLAERTGTELVVPNPAGGRGVYILPWGSARQLCRPTVHDTRLYERIGQLPALTPSAVRQAARAIAADGFAGREAQAACAAAAEAENAERLLANFLLLMALVEEVEPGTMPVTARTQPTPETERRAKHAVAQFAPTLGKTSDQVAADLEALAVLFGPVGVAPHADTARLPRMLRNLGAFCQQAQVWADIKSDDDDISAVARTVAGAAEHVAAAAEAALREARALAGSVTGLLRAWVRGPAALTNQISRADWLLDGWDRIVSLWRDARGPAGQRAALLEIAQLVPVVPQEALAQGRPDPAAATSDEECRVITLNEGWRTGPASFALIARNERLRAQGA